MIAIKKGPPPAELVALAQRAAEQGLGPREAYETLRNPEKQKVLGCLLEEQGHLCAYCMRKLPDERSEILPQSIEHWFACSPPGGEDRGQGLDYSNFLAVCSGNRGGVERGKKRLTCDAHRENETLTVNPTDPSTLETIFYSENGDIHATDPIIDDDLALKLNLNCVFDSGSLSEFRKSALGAVEKELVENSDTQEALMEACRQLLGKFELEIDPKTPYVGIIIWKLKQYINAGQKLPQS